MLELDKIKKIPLSELMTCLEALRVVADEYESTIRRKVMQTPSYLHGSLDSEQIEANDKLQEVNMYARAVKTAIKEKVFSILDGNEPEKEKASKPKESEPIKVEKKKTVESRKPAQKKSNKNEKK